MARVNITVIIDKTTYKSAQNVFNAAWNGIIDAESNNIIVDHLYPMLNHSTIKAGNIRGKYTY